MIDTAVMSNDALIEFAEGLSRIASTGGGPKALAAHLATLLDAAVLVEDGEWRHIALAGTASARSIPPSARDLISNSEQRDGSIPLVRPGDGIDGVAVPIRGGDSPLGWLAAFPNSAPADGRLGAVRLAAAAIGVELSRDAGGGKNRRKSFWDRLIARSFDDPIEARDDAAARGITLASNSVAVAVEAEGLDEGTATAKMGDLRRLSLEGLRSGPGEIVVLERGAGFVFLCPAPLEIDAANVRTAATLIPRNATKMHFSAKIVGGIGRPMRSRRTARSKKRANRCSSRAGSSAAHA